MSMGKCGSIAAVVATGPGSAPMEQLVADVRERASVVRLVHLVEVRGPKVFTARYATERARVDFPNWGVWKQWQ